MDLAGFDSSSTSSSSSPLPQQASSINDGSNLTSHHHHHHQQQRHQSEQPQALPTVPKPAPSYHVLEAVIEKKDDGPGPRCGHTLTAIAGSGEPGSSSYIAPRLILFGGATALEGNSGAQAGPQTPGGSSGISKFFVFIVTCLEN